MNQLNELITKLNSFFEHAGKAKCSATKKKLTMSQLAPYK